MKLPLNMLNLLRSAAGRLTVRSALNPMLWLCAIVPAPCFLSAAGFGNDLLLRWLLVIVGCLPIVSACVGFLYFAFRKPEKLQSEDYQLRERALSLLMVSKGRRVQLDLASLHAITNPRALELPSGETQ